MNKKLPLLLGTLVLLSCDDPPTPAEPEPEPGLPGVSIDASTGPIFRTLAVTLEGASGIQVEYWAADGPRLLVSSPDAAVEHSVFLPRLRSETQYEFEIYAIGDPAQTPLHSGQFETESLPANLSTLSFEASGDPTFPLTMLEVRFPTWRQVIVDSEGEIVWFRPGDNARSTGFTRLANGDFVFNEQDFLSVVTPDLQTVAVLDRNGGIGLMHHDVITTPQNTVLVLTHDRQVVNDTLWTGEAIWEWDPATDDVAKRWSSFDHLNPTDDRGSRTVPNDWLHANSLAIGPRGNVVVSLYWLHEVLSIAPGYESLEWRLGGPNSTFDVAGGAMDAGQHTAAEVSTDRVLLFDNGLDRPGGLEFSRASEIQLNQETNTAEIVWEFRPDPDIYAAIMSSARRLENGNTVVAFGTAAGPARSTGPIRIFEVTPASQVVWSLTVQGVQGVYRATPLEQIGGEVELE